MYGYALSLARDAAVKSAWLNVYVKNFRTGEKQTIRARLGELDGPPSTQLSARGAEMLLISGANLWSHGWDLGEITVLGVEVDVDE